MQVKLVKNNKSYEFFVFFSWESKINPAKKNKKSQTTQNNLETEDW